MKSYASRRVIQAVAAVVLSLVVGCGGDDGVAMEENGLVGTWRATSILVNGEEVLAGTDGSLDITFREDRTVTLAFSGSISELFCGDAGGFCTERGTYQFTDTELTVCDPECDEAGQYVLSGDMLTYSVLLQDPLTALVITLVRA